MNDKPYFSVGEEVILESINTPEINGDATVIQIVESDQMYQCPHCGRSVIGNGKSSFGYFLDVYSGGCCSAYEQFSLRKKHDKGMDFESLVESLKTPLEVNQ